MTCSVQSREVLVHELLVISKHFKNTLGWVEFQYMASLFVQRSEALAKTLQTRDLMLG